MVRTGLVLLVLGVAYAGTLLVLTRLRSRRREQLLTDEHNAQVEREQEARAQEAQAHQYGQPGFDTYPPAGQTYPPADQTYPAAAQVYPASEPGPGR